MNSFEDGTMYLKFNRATPSQSFRNLLIHNFPFDIDRLKSLNITKLSISPHLSITSNPFSLIQPGQSTPWSKKDIQH